MRMHLVDFFVNLTIYDTPHRAIDVIFTVLQLIILFFVCGLCHHLQPDLILDNFPDLLVEAWSYFFFLTNVYIIH